MKKSRDRSDGMSECRPGGIGMGNLIRLSSARVQEGPLGHEDSFPFRPEGISENRPVEPEEVMLDELDRRDRLRLVEFVCSFAWADLEIQPEERVFISGLIRRLELGEEDDLQVQRWLELPPRPDHLDPTSIPAAHRRIFVEEIEGLIAADGEVSEEERDSLEIFKQLLVD
jgi:hypothetical protein